MIPESSIDALQFFCHKVDGLVSAPKLGEVCPKLTAFVSSSLQGNFS